MFVIAAKEIRSFFSSSTGYLVIAIFLLVNGLFLWVFQGGFNVFDSGFADLQPFFQLAPWILIFLCSAVTMRSFSEELKTGTIELLLTKPISVKQIVLGKYLGGLFLILISLLPTCSYILTIAVLGNPPGNWDLGSTLGSYAGLIFISMSLTAIGIFSSTLSENQIVVFIIALFISFFLYYGFEGIASYNFFGNSDYAVSRIGMQSHFQSMSRGVIDTREILYFCSVAVLFLVFTTIKLKSKKN